MKRYQAHKSQAISKSNLLRANKLKFLKTFDPSKVFKASNLYTKYVNQEMMEKEETSHYYESKEEILESKEEI